MLQSAPPRRPGARPLTPRQVAFTAMVGTAVELYDFILYSFVAALVFGPLFFPGFHPWVGTLVALSSHAVAFVTRPLGAVVFGWVGDRFGRRPALVASLGLMGVATVGVGLLPTYQTIGLAAPLVLVGLRLLQGMAVGGEYPGAVVVAVEHAPPGRRTFFGAFAQLGIMLGILLAGASLLIANAVVGVATFQAWGWRLPFLFSAVLVICGLVLRNRLAETPEFVAAAQRLEAGRRAGRLSVLLRHNLGTLVVCTMMWIGPVTFGYAFLTGLLAYTKTYVPELSATTVQIGLVLTATVLVGVAGSSAWFGDRWGRERTLLLAGVWMMVWAAPSYWLIETASAGLLWTAMILGGLAYGAIGGVAPSLMTEMFPVEVRYLGVAIAIAVSAFVGGAVLPLGALAVVGAAGGASWPMVAMMIVAGAASTVAGAILHRSRAARQADVAMVTA
ncbi:MFS transporter [Kribbella sp. NPDC048915]|uniref:MFS transporter n=1 Tax=Kribbella sp. NPDC048915 TaxID=3155148 RepID=UPI0033F1FEBC